MTSPNIVTPTASVKPLWLAAISNDDSTDSPTFRQDESDARKADGATETISSHTAYPKTLFSQSEAGKSIQLAPFRNRLTLRRQRYVPLGDRSPWETLAPLFAGGQLAPVATGQWCPTSSGTKTGQVNHSSEQWILATLVKHTSPTGKVQTSSQHSSPTVQLTPYLYMGIAANGDLNLRLLPTHTIQGREFALSTLDGVGREFKISVQASFIQRIAQLQEMQLELGQELAIRQSLYNSMAKAPLRPSQALRYFDRLLDESPYAPSKTPASDRLLQRRQLLQLFSTNPNPTLWDAYGAVAQWINYAAPGNAAQRWYSCCHGPGATMLRQALAYAVALQYDQQDAEKSSPPSPISGAQRSLAASDALQNRIQQLRDDKRVKNQPVHQLVH